MLIINYDYIRAIAASVREGCAIALPYNGVPLHNEQSGY